MGEEIKRLKGKISFKHETEADWAMSNYIPKNGELVLYDPDEKHEGTRLKRGDGINYVKDLPFINGDKLISGEGKDSLVNNISNPTEEYRENESITNYSTALGVSNVAGALAFNIIDYDVDNMTYTLDSPLPEEAFNIKMNEYEVIPIGTNGAYYSVMLPSVQRHFLGNIIAISEDRRTVTVSTNRPSLEIGNGKGKSDWAWIEDDTLSNGCYLKLPYYPLAGTQPFGDACLTVGELNAATAFGAYSSGYNNISDGKYSVTLGRENEAAWSSAAIGARNKSHGIGSYTFGLDNKSTEMGAVAINQYNIANNSRAFVAGIGNHSSASNQTVVGQYNQNNSNALFIVGNGTGSNANVTSRSNAFVVLKDGRAKITAPPTENMDVVNKNYVDTKENDLKTQINNTKKECKAYTDNVITNLDVPSGLEVENPLGSSPIILDPQPAGTKMDLKFSYSDPVETDITYALYADNLLIKQTEDTILKNISNSTILKCDEYGVMTFPVAVNSGGTFFAYSYNKNGLLPLATSGKITIAMHINDGIFANSEAIQFRCDIWYEDANKEIKNSSNNQSFACNLGQVRVFDIDKFTSDFGPIVGMNYAIAWKKGASITSEVEVYPAIYRGDVSSSINGLSIPTNLTKGNSQQFATIANNTTQTITIASSDITSIAGFYEYGVNSKGKTVYKSFDDLKIYQTLSASKIEAGENIELSFGEDGKTLIINSAGNNLPTENKQAGAFLRLDNSLNPIWQMIPIAEDAAF